jgi:drug/metabolite transporter (DMT)-like permease
MNLRRLHGVRDWGMLLFCNLIWGSQFVIYKVIQRQTGPIFAVLLPISAATLLLSLLVFGRDGRTNTRDGFPMTARHAWQFVLLGTAGQVIAQLFAAWGVRYTLATNAALLVLTLPVVVAILAYFLLGERMTPTRWTGFAVVIVGIVMCSGDQWSAEGFATTKHLLGNLMVFTAVCGSAFYNSYSKKLLVTYSPLEVLLYSYYVAIAVMLPLALYTEWSSFLNILHFREEVWFGFILLAIFQYFLAMILFLSVLKRLDATQVGLSNYLIPVFGVLVATIVLGEHATKPMVLGGILVLAGTLLVTVYDRRIDVAREK